MNKHLKEWLKKSSPFNSHPYLNETGKVTIGWGRDIDKGISIHEADFMFENDLDECIRDLYYYPWYLYQSENVKAALVNMCLSLGIKRLLTFHKLIAALTDKDYTHASIEVLNSKWAQANAQRARDIALMIRQG